jgi:hypothetical protein
MGTPAMVVTPDTAMNEARTIPHLDLAAEALLDGWTREQVIAALVGRVKRDQGYLAYRKACNRRTSYDSQVQQDIRALSLAAVWLAEGARSAEGKAN